MIVRCHVFGVSPHHLLRNVSVERLTVGGLNVNISLPDLIIKNIIFSCFSSFHRVYTMVKNECGDIHDEVYLAIFEN